MDIPITEKRPIWPRLLTVLVILAAVGAGVLVLTAYARKWRTLRAEDYLLAKVERGAMATEISMGGELVPRKEIEVLALVSGSVREIAAQEGNQLSPGQLMARLDSREIAAQLRQARDAVSAAAEEAEDAAESAAKRKLDQEAVIAEAEADLDAAGQRLERLKGLLAAGAATRREYEEAEKALATARQQLSLARKELPVIVAQGERMLQRAEERLRQAQADLTSAQADMALQQVVSPCHGTVTACSVSLGRPVGAGEKLFAVTDLSVMDVVLNVDQNDLPRVKLGQTASVTVNEYKLQGRVVFIAPTVAAAGGGGEDGGGGAGVQVKVEILDALPPQLLPRMKVDVAIRTSYQEDVLCLPRGPFLASLGSEEFVFVKGSEGRFHKRRIKIGSSSAEKVEISSGLREGEAVLVSSYDDFLGEEQVLMGKEGEWVK